MCDAPHWVHEQQRGQHKAPGSLWDVILTIVLLVAGAGLAVLLAFFGVFLVFASDSCGVATDCISAQLSIGITVATVAPIVLFVIAAIVAIVLLVKRRLAFWVPLVGMALSALGWGAGFLLVGTSVRGFFG